jgi:hypothetical protein
MVTSPADQRLIVDPSSPAQVVRGSLPVHARAWGAIDDVTLSIDQEKSVTMQALDGCSWSAVCNFDEISNGPHVLSVTARTPDGKTANDSIAIYVNRQGVYDAPSRRDVDYENATGAWPEKHILGTQLGPNENGHPWPPRRDRERVIQ